MPFLKASHLEVIVTLNVIFDGRPPSLGGCLAGGAKSGDVKSELLRRGCSSATITQSGVLRPWGLAAGVVTSRIFPECYKVEECEFQKNFVAML